MDEQEIFHIALEKKSPEERNLWLDQACGQDRAQRERIETLIRNYLNAKSFLEQPPDEVGKLVALMESSESLNPDRKERSPDPPRCESTVRFHYLKPSGNPDRLGRIGHYEVESMIGAGGAGHVLKALDTKLQRLVAIKILNTELSSDPIVRKRFLREARAAAAVIHPHVVTIHAVEEDTVPFLVMELISGKSLQQKLKDSGPLNLAEILRIGSQIAQGLAAAHRQGLIHRDIKPGNILLENGVERVKITDFGLARAVDDASLTNTGDISGTPNYMSPEQAQGERVDHRSDLFSLGSVLYAMCTGRPPFRGQGAVTVIRKVIDEEPISIGRVNTEIPVWLSEIVRKLMQKDPDLRFQSAAEVAEILESRLLSLQAPSGNFDTFADIGVLEKKTAGAGRSNLPGKFSLWPSDRRFLVGSSILVAVCLVGVTSFFLFSQSGPRVENEAQSIPRDSIIQNATATDQSNRKSEGSPPVYAYSRIIDDRDPDYTETQLEGLKEDGGWHTGSDVEASKRAYGKSYRFVKKGAMTARWTFDRLPPGGYEVFCTWPASPRHTALVTYNVYDGETKLKSFGVDLAVPPSEHPISDQHAGADWAYLDAFHIDSGTLIVEVDSRVSISRGGGIVCDAVWVRSKNHSNSATENGH
ncbi:MAG: protein kinase [Planctomycetaceae bacterium]|nr:protein kinase [Planctomycetaceae bacterium]